MKGSFRRAVAVTAALMLAALLGMALVLAVGLQRADGLLDRMSRSQDQLAQVTRIEADINGLLIDAAAGRSDAELAGAAARIESELMDYRDSITAETRLIGPGAVQAAEASNAVALSKVFASLSADLLAADPAARLSARGRIEAGRAVFAERASAIVDRERQEVADTFAAMHALRGGFTWLGFAIPLAVGLIGAVVVWGLMQRVARPLREIEAAARKVDPTAHPAPIEVGGFSEFRTLADAFNRMGEWTRAREIGLDLGALTLDLRAREARLGGQSLSLPPREFDLLRRLAETPGASVARHDLLDRVWGEAADVSDNLVDVYVGYLRRRLAAYPDAPRIETVRGVGFKLVVV